MRNDCCKKALVVGILVCTLLIAIAVLPVAGTQNIFKNTSREQQNVLGESSTGLLALTVNVETDKTVYKRLERVEVTISVTNNGKRAWTHLFPDTQLADFDVGRGLYRWSRDKGFFMIPTSVTIKSGETKVLLRDHWNQKTNLFGGIFFKNQPFPPGDYKIRGWIALFKFFPTPPFGYSEKIKISSLMPDSNPQNNINDYVQQSLNPLSFQIL